MSVKDTVNSGKDTATDMKLQLVRDVRMLTRYAIEAGQLPAEVDAGDVYQIPDGEVPDEALTRKLVGYLALLERRFPEVTALTLAATEPGPSGRIWSSRVGRYLAKLWIWTGVVVVLILCANLGQFLYETTQPDPGDDWTTWAWVFLLVYRVSEYFEPFLYGALGAFVYLLRVSEAKLTERSFDPRRAPEHVNRLILGSISGGTIILLIAQLPADDGTYIQVSAAALGFLAGYSIDFLFHTIDRVIQAILPKVGLDTLRRRDQIQRNQELIRRYQAMLDKGEGMSEAEKELLTDIIDRLQTP